MRPEDTKNADTPQGLAFAVSAYLLWGFLPLYLREISHVPLAEVVAHRIIWSIPVAGLVLIILRRTGDLRMALRDPGMLAMGCVTALLVLANWSIYVWAISAGRAIDAALGYYINPLFSVFLGAILLGERPDRAQMLAIALAAAAVVVLTLDAGQIPWVALALTFSWGFYAFFKKSLPIGPNQGFLLEVVILMVPALGWILWLTADGRSHFMADTPDTLLLMGCGVATAAPLILYANGAKLLRLSTIGILQYIAPTMIFLIAVLIFGEELDRARMIAFPMIWLALVIYSTSLVRQVRRARPR